MKRYGIIFDCDGTLVNSLGQALESFVYALQQVGENRTPAEVKRYFGAAADRIFLRMLGDEAKALRAFEYYLDHQTGLAATTKLHPGIREMLEELGWRQVPMGIVTGRHERDLEIVLTPHRLFDYFSAMVTDNHLPNSKPAPDGILLAARKMGLPPAQTLYVGDSVMDMQAARAAGSVPVAALWDSLVKPEEMAAEKPEFMARTPSEVLTFFAKRFVETGIRP